MNTKEIATSYLIVGEVFTLPEDYVLKDENGNVINTTKIVLEKKPDDKLKLESTKKVREYWSEYTRIFIETYDDAPNECILTHLLTLEGYRQKGYGRQALIEAELIAKELGCHTAYLKVETNSWMHEWYLRMDYKWYKNVNNEYTWLTKNLTGVERKKEYPKTYEECAILVDCPETKSTHWLFDFEPNRKSTFYRKVDVLMGKMALLLICRQAYWKIAGEEIGLGESWKPDLKDGNKKKYCINNDMGDIQKDSWFFCNAVLAFPTEEMREAFYENFKKEIEQCKELL